jgi:undecaprenyl-diphosphatase
MTKKTGRFPMPAVGGVLMLALIVLVWFFVLAIAVKSGVLVVFNGAVYEVVSANASPFLTAVSLALNYLGKWYVWLVLAAVLLAFRRTRHFGVLAFTAIFLTEAAVVVLKPLLLIPRPSAIWLVSAYGYGFPSGHAATAAAFMAVLVLFARYSKWSPAMKLTTTVLAVSLVVLICLSRIYLGVHSTTDVVGGCLLGIGGAGLAVYLTQIMTKRHLKS